MRTFSGEFYKLAQKGFVKIDHWGIIRKWWQQTATYRDNLRKMAVFKYLPNWLWYIVVWYILIMPQFLILSLIGFLIYWNLI